MKNTGISVCMATLNGEKFIAEQVTSIILQLSADDELIIVDDCSTDETLKILQGFNDVRIKIFQNKTNKGVNSTFERAIFLATHDIIFLADQDDIWRAERVKAMVKALQDTRSFVVSANSEYIDLAGKAIYFPFEPLKAADSSRYLKNILKIFYGTASYFGCAMAFKRDLFCIILPIPSYVESHDLWIALAGNLLRSNCHIENNVLMRRVHGNNASLIKRPLTKKIWSRIIFVVSIFHLYWRYFRWKATFNPISIL